MAMLLSQTFDFDNWDTFFCNNNRDSSEYARWISEGKAILRDRGKNIKTLINNLATRGTVAGYDVPIINVPGMYASDIGHILAQDEPFAVMYSDSATHRSFSLRSEPNGIDVQDIAIRYGGGGHKHAAGFEMPLENRIDI